MPSPNPYQLDLDKNAANYVPLTPLTFIRRTADVYPERTAVIHGGLAALKGPKSAPLRIFYKLFTRSLRPRRFN